MALSYQQAFDYIHSFDDPYLAAIRNHGRQTWGQERIRERLRELGDPHLAYPTIHVAGTKGKGSTCAFIAQILQESGCRTGLYTSPHLEDWRERIQVNREMIPEDALAKLVEDYQASPGAVERLSAFEVTTALALWHFARVECDIAVIEVGLGGRLDATTVVEPVVAVITNISLDHTQLLGNTLAEIAGEKAAIIKQHTLVISGPQHPEALAVIEARAAEMNAPLTLVGRDWQASINQHNWQGSDAQIGCEGDLRSYHIGLPGEFQVENAAVAVATAEAVRQAADLNIDDASISRALANIQWSGRLEIIRSRPAIILDSAHNPYSIARLAEEFRSLGGFRHLTIIFGAMADKNTEEMIGEMLPICTRIIFTRTDHPRAAEPQVLQQQATDWVAEQGQIGKPLPTDVHVDAFETLAEALDHGLSALSPEDALCITGSLALAGNARVLLRARGLMKTDSACAAQGVS